MLLLGDCNDWLKDIKDNSIDLLLTDPPYGIEFMGKDWDKALVQKETWKECYRVLKEGKLAFVMCSPRQDVLSRMIINLQDAGFRTNYTSIYWTYASGFPKAANVSKLLDKKAGQDMSKFGLIIKNRRTELGLSQNDLSKHFPSISGGITGRVWMWEEGGKLPTIEQYNKLIEILKLDKEPLQEVEREIIKERRVQRNSSSWESGGMLGIGEQNFDITKPATAAAKKMEGAYVGFQPKPAVEVILVVSKGKTLTWLDDCRIPYQSEDDIGDKTRFVGTQKFDGTKYATDKYTLNMRGMEINGEKGRFPANLLVSDDCLNDGKITKSPNSYLRKADGFNANSYGEGMGEPSGKFSKNYGDEGFYSRYFSLDSWSKTFPFLIVPKASRSERGHFNTHSTVKPIRLMSYLITMGSREGDLVLDPFCGSGTVCIAADQLHRKWIGIEKNEEYASIIKKRLMVPLSQLKLSVWSGKKKDDSDGSQRIC